MREPDDWPTEDLLSHRAAATPDRTALVDAGAGESWTYRRLDSLVDDTAGRLASLASLGSGGGVVGLLVGTRPAFVRTLHGAWRRSAAAAPFDARLAEPALRSQVGRADPDVLVCEAATEDLALAVADCAVASVDPPRRDAVGSIHPDDLDPARGVRRERDPGEAGLVVFTSGTTGEPKGVRLTAGNLVASAIASAFRLGVRPDDRWLVPLPTCHVGGLAPLVRSTLYGTAVVLQRAFDAGETARVVDEHAATGVSLVPTMLARMLDAGWEPPDHLRFVLLGGAPASRALIERCEARGVPVHPTYGLTEAASQVATARPAEAFEHPGTVGQPLLFADVTVLGDGEPADAGETGEIVVDGPTVTPGYLDDGLTREAFGDRGLHTGDLGYRDGDGRLWVLGRADDAVLTGGETVHPAEVARAIREHPAVEDAAVVDLPDPEWGERVAALVVGDADPDELAAHCRERLAGYEVPKTWGIADELPRTASGTVDREAVRERLGGDV